MILNTTITKKILEAIIHETFSKLGSFYSSSLLDSLKLLGFSYATNAGISINIEDLKTPDVKQEYIDGANHEIATVSYLWKTGKVSETERFQAIIDSWNVATESLKLRIVDYYQDFDPANNLYIMAFSGARGNMSQVRQLVGMRGLMSDQEGRIIDLPIQRNFREGLSSIDYVISSYGARKGIVDTALKTADSGYLTRRLIYLAQDLVIREVDCRTKKGVVIFLKKTTEVDQFIGNFLSSAKRMEFPYLEELDSSQLLTSALIKQLKQKAPLHLTIRSVLTCESQGSLCQKCYGWDLSKRKVISLGETVGITAAQSIGEPGTQLTMRTFHTGGIFTGETVKQILSPLSGKIIFPDNMKALPFRTNHGTLVRKIQQETVLRIQNWKGEEKTVVLFVGSYLYLPKSNFIRAGERIAEYSTQAFVLGKRRLKPFYSPLSGEVIKCENLHLRKRGKSGETPVCMTLRESVLWIGSAKIFSLPKEAMISFSKRLQKSQSIGRVKMMTPESGIIEFQEKQLILWKRDEKIVISLSTFESNFPNSPFQFVSLVKNYQYVDEFTILGYFYFYPSEDGKIYSLRRKRAFVFDTYFCLTDSDIWKIESDQVNQYSFFPEKKQVLLPSFNPAKNPTVNAVASFTRPGMFLKKDGFQMLFQDATPVFLNPQTILNYKLGDCVFKKSLLGTLLNYTQQTEDIVQGLPKVEELIEARQTKEPCLLASRPGVLITETVAKDSHLRQIEQNTSEFFPSNDFARILRVFPHVGGQKLCVIHSFLREKKIVLYKNLFYELTPMPKNYVPYTFPDSKKKLKTLFVDENDVFSQLGTRRMDISYKEHADLYLPGSLELWEKVNRKSLVYKHPKYKEYILQLEKENLFVFLKPISLVSEYSINPTSKVIVQKGQFIDIAQPLTEGTIDMHRLLRILFQYHLVLDGTVRGTRRSLGKFQLILANSIQAIYQSQGVTIATKHIEIVVRQMTSKATVLTSGSSPFLPGEILSISLLSQIYETFEAQREVEQKENKATFLEKTRSFEPPHYAPTLLSATQASLRKDGFLSPAGFQETRRVLSKAAIEGKLDWLRGLKESVIAGRLIPAGTSFLNYKNYLDKIYTFQDSL